MKRTLLFLFSIIALNAFAQPPTAPGEGNHSFYMDMSRSQRSVGPDCGADTLEYIDSKSLSYLPYWIDGTGYMGYGQYFDCPNPIKLEGMKFYGFVSEFPANKDTVEVWMKVYTNLGIDSIPLGMADDSIKVKMTKIQDPSEIENEAYRGYFSKPLDVSNPFFITIENRGMDTVYVYANDDSDYDGNGEGAGENLGFYNWENVWYRNIDWIIWDVDYVFEPIVRYAHNIDMTLSEDSICAGNQVFMERLSGPTPLVGNRMYNYPFHIGSHWEFGDGSVSQLASVNHAYNNRGEFSLKQIDSIFGWHYNCVDSVIAVDVDSTAAIFSRVKLSPGTIDFTNLSIDADSYKWDFGDGNVDLISVSPIHNYDLPGIYDVSLIAMSGRCENDTSTVSISPLTLGIKSLGNEILVYPNPSNDVLILEGNILGNTEVSIFNLLGEEVERLNFSGSNLKINTSKYDNGVYLLFFELNNKSIIKKFNVAHK